jgi:DNA-binding XRE family transcriptional regulator
MLRKARIGKGLSQVKAAKAAKINATYWCACERGLREPSLKIASRMYSVVGIRLEVGMTAK